MTRSRILTLALCLAAVSASFLADFRTSAAAQGGAKLILEVTGSRNTKGNALVSIYNSEGSFLERDEAVKINGKRYMKLPIKKTMRIEIPGLKPGTYAVGIVHDEDKDNGLDQWLGFGPPKEGVGMSRNPDSWPKWKKCNFKFDGNADKTLKIKMTYLGSDAGG